jgi:tripartite-type tricarboxylate transporter receptor subunit TctC
MTPKKARLCLSAVAAFALLAVACSAPAAPAPTAAPAAPKAAEPTKPAAAPPAPTAAPAAAAPTAAPAAAAKTSFPDKSRFITYQVPYDAGSIVDVAARLLAAGMEKDLGVPVQVVNKPGGGSQIGMSELTRQKPDGYYIGVIAIPTANMAYLDPTRKATYSGKDITPIGVQNFDPSAVAVAGNGPYKTIKDIIDKAKTAPDAVKFGSDGPMTDDHLGTYVLEKGANVKFAGVAFDSDQLALTALLGGHIDAIFGHVGAFLAQAKTGSVRVIAVASDKRDPFFPDVPTVQEQGFNLVNASTRMTVGPAGMDPAVLDVLNKSMARVVADPEHSKKLTEMGLGVRTMNSQEAAAFFAQEEKRAKELVDIYRQ